ncbi:MAG TPA: OB-fold nucleic acid binding domain-containing protein [Acidimicrobiales bacterium]
MALFSRAAKAEEARLQAETSAAFAELGEAALEGVIPIGTVEWRARVKVAGRIKALRIQPWSEKIQSLELTLVDGTGGITVVFLGRRSIGGVKLGARLVVEGTVAETRNQLALLNPAYQLLPHEVALPF